MKICILTARLDSHSQLFFDGEREKYFPKERNFLKAHLTLFHQLPDIPAVKEILKSLEISSIRAEVNNLKSIGNGVAYFVFSPEVEQLHNRLKRDFEQYLIPQDRQSIRPHITIQNKVSAQEAKALLLQLQSKFEPFEISIQGLDLWYYLGGPWQHYCFYPFKPA